MITMYCWKIVFIGKDIVYNQRYWLSLILKTTDNNTNKKLYRGSRKVPLRLTDSQYSLTINYQLDAPKLRLSYRCSLTLSPL